MVPEDEDSILPQHLHTDGAIAASRGHLIHIPLNPLRPPTEEETKVQSGSSEVPSESLFHQEAEPRQP